MLLLLDPSLNLGSGKKLHLLCKLISVAASFFARTH